MKKFLIILVLTVVLTFTIFLLFPETKKMIGLDSDPPKIGVQPFGSIDQAEVDSVLASIERMYGFDAVILEYEPMPEIAYTTIRYPRYRADTLLYYLTTIKPDSIDIIVGITNQDISITKYKENSFEIKEPVSQYRDFGIFGLGRVNGTACVVSSNRLHKNVSSRKFYKRLMRITCHEVGHVLGLRHCPEANCLMNDANESIKTIDNSTGDLCKSCWARIH